MLSHFALLSHVSASSVGLCSLLMSLLIYRRCRARSIRCFLVARAVLAVYAEALAFYGKEIVGGRAPPSS